LTPLKVGAHEYLFMTGDNAEEVYFVKSGKLALVIPDSGNFKFLMIKPGSYFGEIDILFYGEKRKYTIMTTKKCEFYVLSKKHFKLIYLN
jgi:CRP-like cAMP-binding protein